MLRYHYDISIPCVNRWPIHVFFNIITVRLIVIVIVINLIMINYDEEENGEKQLGSHWIDEKS